MKEEIIKHSINIGVAGITLLSGQQALCEHNPSAMIVLLLCLFTILCISFGDVVGKVEKEVKL